MATAGRATTTLLCFAILAAACSGGQGTDTLVAPVVEYTPIEPIDPIEPPAAPPTTDGAAIPAHLPARPAQEVRRPLVISGTGDVNLDPRFVRTFPSTGYEYAWTGLGSLFTSDDLTIVNLECSASDLGTPWEKPYTFRCDPAALPSMAAAGVDVANLANNHAIDYGFDAMLDARKNLMASGITPVGAGKDSAEAYQPAVFEIGGWTVAVIGAGGVHPETGSWIAGVDRPGMTDGDSSEAMAKAIAAAAGLADLVIVTVHWGEQGTTTPRDFEIELAKSFIDAGADAIFGHHQHRLQPLGWYHGKPIAWGLGNFVWQTYPPQTAIARFTFAVDGTVSACLVPVLIESPGHPVVQTPDPTPCVHEGTD
jgi:Bacterial capsule synthesis protein PGA_cap